jgi:hypothetical protein
MWGIFIHIKTDSKDFINMPSRGWLRLGMARPGLAGQGRDSFNNLTDSELLLMSKETKRTTPGAIKRIKKNENLKVSDYRRSTPSNAQRSNGKSVQ